MLKKVRKWVVYQTEVCKKTWEIAKALTAYQNGDYESSRPVFEKYAELGLSLAQFELAQMYKNGHGVAQDHTKAFQLYEQAAKQGDARAQMVCSVCCLEGTGTPEDHAQALYWLEKAAEQGIDCAQNMCGEFYFKAIGTEQNMEKALFWSENAAEQGNLDAQLRCVRICACGSYVDLAKAERWLHTVLTSSKEIDPTEIVCAYFGLFIGWSEKAGQTSELDGLAELQTLAKKVAAVWTQPEEHVVEE